jgi:hypothetical protein
MKTCNCCKKEKAANEFHKNKRESDGLSNRCTACQKAAAADYYRRNKDLVAAKSKSYYKANSEKIKERTSFYWTERNTGVGREEYMAKAEAQGFKCAICFTVDPKRRLAADHDHKTGKARGLLCRDCNQVLGKFNDDPDRFVRAANYIKQYSEIA